MAREHSRRGIPWGIPGEEFYTKWFPLGNSWVIPGEFLRIGEPPGNNRVIPGEFPGNGES